VRQLKYMTFSKRLIDWYISQKRDLPWRNTKDPYVIWLSEIILQQTRVAQGLPYFLKFKEAFPDVFALARADEQEVLKLWQGLGYYSRARNLHQTAQYIAFENQGEFPGDFKGLKQLKGVGNYTAAAIASFSFGEIVPVVDGNVYRVLSRYMGITTDISSTEAYRVFSEKAAEVIDRKHPDLFNQAIMEFGAIKCLPKNPECVSCPLQWDCVAFQTDSVSKLPVKLGKTKVENRYLNYLIMTDPTGNTLVQQRPDQGFWAKLFEFPLMESLEEQTGIDFSDLITARVPGALWADKPFPTEETPILHKLSHRNLYIRFWKLQLTSTIPNGISVDELKKLPFPIVIHNFIEKNF
jgi:A/G-specific adenine glycosylase